MLKITDYHTYFEQLAQKHKSILHNPNAEEKSFFRFGEDELNTFLNSVAKFPCMVLADPEVQPSDNGANQVKGVYTCGIMILDQWPAELNISGRGVAMDNTQQILLDVLAKVRADYVKLNAHKINLNQVAWSPIILRDSRVCGWDLRIELSVNIPLKENPDAWLS